LQCRNVLGHLFLLGGELLYAAPHDIEIRRQRLKLLRRVGGSCSHGWRLRRRDGKQPAQQWSPGYHHVPCCVTVGLPRKRGADTDENRNKKPGKGVEYSPAKRRPVARDMIVLEAGGARRTDRRFHGPSNPRIELGVQIARRPAPLLLYERYALRVH
jgi:hypothetical protein